MKALRRKVRIAVAGCGSVSRGCYLPHLKRHPHVELAAVCDTSVAALKAAGDEAGVRSRFTDAREMIRKADFDLFLNLTAMPAHGPLNLVALRAGKHVYCEKPIATNLADGARLLREAKRRGLYLLGAPATTTSPAFIAADRLIKSGKLGKVCQVRARYGHPGPTWSPWFYQKGGGSLFDLGVYNITTLTGWLGPVTSVFALAGPAIPVRTMDDGSKVRVEADENIVVNLDFGHGTFGVVQCGFFIGKVDERASIEVLGTKGTINLLGYDWAPGGIEFGSPRGDEGHLAATSNHGWGLLAKDQRGWSWEHGAGMLAEALATGRKPVMTGEHAFHVLEVMLGALKSAKSRRIVPIRSKF